MTVSTRDVSPSLRPAPAGNLSTGLLKLIALFFMFVDHSGKVLFNNLSEMRILGRIAFPIYVWCMIVGFRRTRSVPRYLLRILLVGLISQPFYVLALDTQGHLGVLVREIFAPLAEGLTFSGLGEVFSTVFLKKPSIFLSLFLGLAALWGIREKKWLSQFLLPAAALVLASYLNADYGWKGVMLFILLYAVQDSRPGIAAVMVSYFLFWGGSYSVTRSLFGMPIDLDVLPGVLSQPLSAFMRMETYALMALPLILIRFKKDLQIPRWVGYALYPAHLAALYALEQIIK